MALRSLLTFLFWLLFNLIFLLFCVFALQLELVKFVSSINGSYENVVASPCATSHLFMTGSNRFLTLAALSHIQDAICAYVCLYICMYVCLYIHECVAPFEVCVFIIYLFFIIVDCDDKH